MGRRLLAAGLWFTAVLCFYELAWSLVGAPRPVGPLVAAGVAIFVGADPLHLIWSRGAREAATGSETVSLHSPLLGLTDRTT